MEFIQVIVEYLYLGITSLIYYAEKLYIFLNEISKPLYEIIKKDLDIFFIVVSSFVGMIKESSKRNIYCAWATWLVGTLFHELAHYVISLITLGFPKKFSILPKTIVDETNGARYYCLGYVQSSNVRWYNALLISFAPLLLLPISIYFGKNFFLYFEENLITLLVYVFVLVSLVFSSIPSIQDFRVAFEKRIFLASITILILILYFISLLF